MVYAIVNAVTDLPVLQRSGADLTISKSTSPDTIESHLRRAFDAMQSEHLRYSQINRISKSRREEW